jgi:hypothetical protein
MLGAQLTAAFDMARTTHDGDTIKGSDLPYLLHLLPQVMAIGRSPVWLR